MTTLREAAQQALEAWDGGDTEWFKRAYTVMEALRAALAEPVQEPDVPETNFGNMEPVGWLENPFGSFRRNWLWKLDPPPQTLAWSIPLYTAPPQRKPLTYDEIDALALDEDGLPNSHIEIAQAIERAHGIT